MQHRRQNGEGLSVAILGAGIVGCASALALARQGHSVTLFDREEPGSITSYGNAGAIVTGSITPTATPAVIRSLASYVLDKKSPAVLRLHHALSAFPWLIRFLRAGTLAEVERIAAAMFPLVSRALTAHRDLAAYANIGDLLSQEGWLKLYASQAEFDGSALERRLMQKHGVVHRIIERDEILARESGLDPSCCYRGLYQPEAGNVRFPKALAQAYLAAARRDGAQLRRQMVRHLRIEADGRIAVEAEGGAERFDRLVVAGGAWSVPFARQLGDRVSLESERGYHLSFGPGSEQLLNGPIVLPARGFVLSPMHDGLRLVSGDELAGLTAAPNFKRIEALVPEAVAALPALKDWPVATRWMGHRPSTPDTLPIIGPARRSANIIYAFGHGHLGVTLAAVTAQLVNDLVSGQQPEIDLASYSPERF